MASDTFLGIDLGTSGVRAVAIDPDGNILAEARTTLPASAEPQPGWREQDPRDWWRAVLATLDSLRSDHLQDLRAICVDGTSGTLLLCDAQGTPTSPALMYNDQRATAQAARLKSIAPPETAVHSASSGLAKLIWLHDQGYRGAHALHQADWIALQLGAGPGVSDENNCLKLGYDPVARRWPAWMDQAGIDRRQLPQVYPVGQRFGTLAEQLRQRWNCRDEVALVAGTTDSNAATLATGVRDIGDASTALGSTLVVKVLSDRPVFAPEYGIYSHRIGDRWLVGGASNTGGAVLRQFFSDKELATLSRGIDPSRDSGLDYYPLTAPGERFPVNDPSLPPRVTPRPDDDARFLHGLLEGMARIEHLGYQRLAELGAPYPKRIKTSGGGAVNHAWRALRERLIGVPVETAAQSEAAYGAALIAAEKVAC